MKLLLMLVVLTISQHIFAVETLDVALETNGIKVEYIESSKRGIISVVDCSQCSKSQYDFQTPPEIIKKGKAITFEDFMLDYWNAKNATIFLDLRSSQVIKVIY